MTSLRIENRFDDALLQRLREAGHDLEVVGAFEEFMGRYAELGFTDPVFHIPRVDDPVWNESPEIVEKIAEKLLHR